MFRLLVWGFVIYLAYKFLFEFLVPVGKVAKDMKQKVSEMQEQQNQQQANHQSQTTSNTTSKPKVDEKDYIDFEEIK